MRIRLSMLRHRVRIGSSPDFRVRQSAQTLGDFSCGAMAETLIFILGSGCRRLWLSGRPPATKMVASGTMVACRNEGFPLLNHSVALMGCHRDRGALHC